MGRPFSNIRIRLVLFFKGPPRAVRSRADMAIRNFVPQKPFGDCQRFRV